MLEPEPETPLTGSSPILNRLRARYAESRQGVRRKTLMIVPGRYDSMLAVRLKPIDDDELRARAKVAQRSLNSTEAELTFAASMIAEATETILLRDDDGELKPMADVIDQFKGGEPVLWDERLLDAIGIEVPAETVTPAAVVRWVYSNKQALGIAFTQLQAFLSEEEPGDEEDDANPPT